MWRAGSMNPMLRPSKVGRAQLYAVAIASYPHFLKPVQIAGLSGSFTSAPAHLFKIGQPNCSGRTRLIRFSDSLSSGCDTRNFQKKAKVNKLKAHNRSCEGRCET
jgi:hypothetical protein